MSYLEPSLFFVPPFLRYNNEISYFSSLIYDRFENIMRFMLYAPHQTLFG